MAAPFILAKTLLDAHTFAREELGLGRGHYRVVTSPSSISGRRGADLYLVPGHESRHDRFAMRGALKYTRLNKIDVSELQGVPDDLEPAGVQLFLLDSEQATAFLTTLDAEPKVIPGLAELLNQTPPWEETSNGDAMVAAGSPATPEQVEAPANRRRSRCKSCGTLHFRDESCPCEPLPGV